MNYEEVIEYGELQFNRDLEYIRSDVLGIQRNGRYCKYSKPLKGITISNFTKQAYLDYWLRLLKNRLSVQQQIDIKNTIMEKFKTGTLDTKQIIDLELSGNDTAAEKKNIIGVITRLY